MNRQYSSFFYQMLLFFMFIFVFSRNVQSYNIGLLIVATGKYIDFVPPLIESARTYFCTKHRVTYFVFTDGKLPPAPDTIVLHHLLLGWPYDALCKNFAHLAHRDQLMQMDYIFVSDADMLFVSPVDDEILSERVGVLHAAFVGKSGTPETRRESTAFIDVEEKHPYYAAGFYGGTTASFLKMAQVIKANIESDLQHNIIALWHDESHLNRYFVDNPPTCVLSPSYCYPGVPVHALMWGVSHLKPKLIALAKDHAAVRSVKNTRPSAVS